MSGRNELYHYMKKGAGIHFFKIGNFCSLGLKLQLLRVVPVGEFCTTWRSAPRLTSCRVRAALCHAHAMYRVARRATPPFRVRAAQRIRCKARVQVHGTTRCARHGTLGRTNSYDMEPVNS